MEIHMDITKFNKELAYKVAKANGLEKNHKLQAAIDVWLEISDMAIMFSKRPNLDFSYKSMLIEKTKQIINHIKALKAEIIDHRGKIRVLDSINPPSNIPEPEPIPIEPTDAPKEGNDAPLSEEKEEDIQIIEDTDLKNLPIGFKEIKPKEDFKIITPHDKDYIKNLISKEPDLAKNKKDEGQDQKRIELDKPKDKRKVICFACGTEVSSRVKKCPNCGTELKQD
jgi:hypothetical protein